MKPLTRHCVRALVIALCIPIAHSLVLTWASAVVSGSSLQSQDSQNGYQRHFPIFLGDESDFDAYGIEGKGTRNEPYVLRNVNITSTSTCLSLSGSSSFFVVEHCYFACVPGSSYGFGIPVSVGFTENLVIRDCIIAGGMYGVLLEGVSNSVLEHSIVRDCTRGVYCTGQNITLNANRVMRNRIGVTAYSLQNSTISQNKIYVNSNAGVDLGHDSSGNTIWGNHFGWNGHNALDDGYNNTWDDGSSTGNMWTDYYGFGDYRISIHSSSVDRYPLVLDDSSPPQIIGPEDIIIPSQTTDMTLTWDAIDEYPLTCNVTIAMRLTDEAGFVVASVLHEVLSPEWDYDRVDITLPPLPEGPYSVIAEFWDAAGNRDSYHTTVEVQRGVTAGEVILIATSVGVFASGVFVLEMIRKRGKRETPAVLPNEKSTTETTSPESQAL